MEFCGSPGKGKFYSTMPGIGWAMEVFTKAIVVLDLKEGIDILRVKKREKKAFQVREEPDT